MLKQQPAIVVIGGGTGSFTLLQELKNVTNNLTALVSMADDGGSTGVLRDELGVLPPGDVRQCLVALSNAPTELRELFNFRFGTGTFAGHSFGNLFLSAVEKIGNNFADAVRLASEVLQITGRVVPITLNNCNLVLHNGKAQTIGQYEISHNIALPRQPDLSLEPHANLNPEALQAILAADIVIIAPGSLYGSLAPALLVDGVAQALAQTNAKVVYVCNLVNKALETPNFRVSDYVSEVERFAGAGAVDYVFYNIDEPLPAQLKKYALDGEFPVIIDVEDLKNQTYTAIAGRFLSHLDQKRQANDTRIERSLIRHDAYAVVAALSAL